MNHISVAVDGPSGAGKSTLSKAVAKKLGFLYVDTGAIYRTVGLFCVRKGVDTTDMEAVEAVLPEITVELSHSADGLQHMSLNGEDVTEALRTPEVSMAASAVAAHPAVRAFLMETQRKLAREHNIIMDGRDIGTVVLPEADVKVYLTASDQDRAWRRTLELDQRGTPTPFEQVLTDLRKRDYDDAHRAIAPLRRAGDAVLLDTSHLTLQESADALEDIIRERVGL